MFIALVVFKLYIFKVSHARKKGDFGLLLGGFSWIANLNQIGFVQNFYQSPCAMQSIIYVTDFNLLLKILGNGPKKSGFF